MKKISIFCFILLLLITSAKTGDCAESKDDAQVNAIQNRVFHRNHEIDLSFGYIPNDDFYHVFPVGIGYIYNFSNYLSWEVAKGEYLLTQEKDLKKDLENEFGVTPSAFVEPQYMISSNLLIKPFYGKKAFFNRGIINQESYILLGGGLISSERQFSYGEPESETAYSVNVGIGTKYFLGKNLCINLELRDMIQIKDSNTENRIYLGIGLGFRFNLRARKAQEDETIQKLKKYLNEDEKNES